MSTLFLYFTRLSLKACVIIPLIIFIRFLIRKQPKIYSYRLWIAVFFCLVADISIPKVNILTPVSAIQSAALTEYNELLDDYTGDVSIYHDNTVEYYKAVNRGVKPVFDYETTARYVVTKKDTVVPAKTVLSDMDFYRKIWFGVILILCLFVAKSSLEIYVKTKNAVYYDGNIYLAGKIPSPFVFGFAKPKIYIPENLALKDLSYIITHEQTHIYRFDWIIKPVCLFITILHWYNPLVWTAYRMFCRDMEMSCDERVIAKLGKDSKKTYSSLLLDFACDNSMTAAVLFGENEAESRIKNVLEFKKPKAVISLLLVIIVILFAALPIVSKPVSLLPSTRDATGDTFYEQLDRVNDIGHLQYKHRMGAEGSNLYPHASVTYTGDGNLYSLITDNKEDTTPKLMPDKNYHYMNCLGVRIDDNSAAEYSMLIFENINDLKIYDYNTTDGWQYIMNVQPGDEYLIHTVAGHEKIADNYYITSLYGRSANSPSHSYLLTVHTIDGVQTINAFNTETFVDGVLRSQPYAHVRSLRFLNENVGIASTTKADSPEIYPHAFITLDGGKTWHEMDFSSLVPKGVELKGSVRGCIVNIYDDIIEIRYHMDKTHLPGTEDNYSVISLDGGLTWAGFHRTHTYNTKNPQGYEYIPMTDTIPVMLKPYTDIEQRNEIVFDTVKNYMHKTITSSTYFQPLPDDFEFSISPSIYGYEENADGTHETYLVSRDNKYRMNITLDNNKVTSVYFSLVDGDIIPGKEMNAEYDKLVYDIISKYYDGTVDKNGNFMELPEGFAFPRKTPPLYYVKDEMGYRNTSIYSRDNKYRMEIMIDNTSYEDMYGNIITNPPHVFAVGFYNAQNTD